MRKQLIFLMTDTTRKDMVGCYGNPKMKTPNLDRLAEEGIRYENAYTRVFRYFFYISLQCLELSGFGVYAL